MTTRDQLQQAFLAHRRANNIAASQLLIAEYAESTDDDSPPSLSDVPEARWDALIKAFVAATASDPNATHVAAADLIHEAKQFSADHGADALAAVLTKCGVSNLAAVPDTERFAVMAEFLAANTQSTDRQKEARRLESIGVAAFKRRAEGSRP